MKYLFEEIIVPFLQGAFILIWMLVLVAAIFLGFVYFTKITIGIGFVVFAIALGLVFNQ